MSFLGGMLRGGEQKVADVSALVWRALLSQYASKAGVSVSIETALRVAPVLACSRVIAEGIAQLPLKLYREKSDGGKELAKQHPLYPRLWRRPNDWQTSFEWRESLLLHATLAKGGFGLVSRGSTGRVLEILPLLPGNVRPVQRADYEVVYEVADRAGTIRTFPRSDLFHLRGPSWDTICGLEMVAQAREAIGLAIATEESQARLHSNGVRPSGILSADRKIEKPERDRIKASFEEGYAGIANAFKTILLDGGLKWAQTSLSAGDAKTMEARQMQVEEICRLFRVFPQMIGFSDKTATFASAEAFFQAHVTHTLGPWIERFEQVISRDLLSEQEVADGYFAKFSVQGLLRGDAKSRAEYFASGIVNGWLTRNEARRAEDYDPLDGLDLPLMPMNMADGTVPPAPPKAPAPAPVKAPPVDQTLLAKAIAEQLGRPDLEAKVGRALSARNEGKLKEARDLLDEVLAAVDESDNEE